MTLSKEELRIATSFFAKEGYTTSEKDFMSEETVRERIKNAYLGILIFNQPLNPGNLIDLEKRLGFLDGKDYVVVGEELKNLTVEEARNFEDSKTHFKSCSKAYA